MILHNDNPTTIPLTIPQLRVIHCIGALTLYYVSYRSTKYNLRFRLPPCCRFRTVWITPTGRLYRNYTAEQLHVTSQDRLSKATLTTFHSQHYTYHPASMIIEVEDLL